jgi:hypothetical protein
MDQPNSFRRGEANPLDISYVFDSVADLEDYLAAEPYINFDPARLWGLPYNGQVTTVLNGTNQPDVYVIWEVPSGTAGAVENQLTNIFYAYSTFGGAPGAAEGLTPGSSTAPASPQSGDLWTTLNGEIFIWHQAGFWIQVA